MAESLQMVTASKVFALVQALFWCSAIFAVGADVLLLRRRLTLIAAGLLGWVLSLTVVAVGLTSASNWVVAIGLIDGAGLIWLAIHLQAPIDDDLRKRENEGLPKRVPYLMIATARLNPVTVLRYRNAMMRSVDGRELLCSRLNGDEIWSRAVSFLARRRR